MGMVGLRDVFVVAPAASFHAPSQHHHHHHHHQESLFPSPDHQQQTQQQQHPIIPLLSAAPCLVDDPHGSKSSAGMHLWQQQSNPNPNPNPNPYLKKPVPMLDTAGMLTATSTSSGSGTTCQDCGNQAKKDCSHRRCRTCCKSRGFDCSTHVRSTWVPAARRRERQISGNVGPGSSASTSAPKKPRLLSSQTTSHTSTSNTTRSYDTSSSHQDASFRESLPGQVRAPAVFKCVRVTSVADDGEDEFAYQAMVKIGGHVFKGFLYDQGVDEGRAEQLSLMGLDSGSNAANNNNTIPNMSELHLGGGGGGRTGGSSSAMLPSDMWGC